MLRALGERLRLGFERIRRMVGLARSGLPMEVSYSLNSDKMWKCSRLDSNEYSAQSDIELCIY